MRSYLEDIAEGFRGAPRLAPRAPNRGLKCPICGADMGVERLHGVEVDVCGAHGVWLDSGEAELLVRRVQSGERASARDEVAEARRHGKISALVLGAWSLFLDDD